jgi:signal transduction histidine kinase
MMESARAEPTILDARILIVDDQQANVRLLERILNRAGYTNLTSTTDSMQAAALFSQIEPDLILLDLAMPGLDGFGVIEQIAPLIPNESYLPILVLTADITPEAKHRALSAGARDFLSKPFDQAEVLLRIKNLLETRSLHLQLQAHNEKLEETVRERTHEVTEMLALLLSAQEDERRRLSMDIHDGPLQSLAVSTMALDTARKKLARGQTVLVEHELSLLGTSLSDAIEEIRAVLANLSLYILTNEGLIPALHAHIERYSGVTGIAVEMEDDLGQRLPGRIELLFYRLAQEALSNVRKHAEAKNVRLSLKVEDNCLFMRVVDDGKGFDVDAVLQRNEAGHHLGLRSMMQRIRDAQGALTIGPAEPKGTTLRFQCPLPGGGAANQER